LNEYIFDHVMAVNAKGIFLVTQALLSVLAATNGTVCNIISNASHVPMTNSLAYNASKAAAMMMTKQMARELWRDHPHNGVWCQPQSHGWHGHVRKC
jgi:NAD(P)-dependent dehydrogenase (short-subunit alcohol dehydrogenase family)